MEAVKSDPPLPKVVVSLAMLEEINPPKTVT
jgi:hypothetical protein